MTTNIKGLPEGNYFTGTVYTDTQVYREVKRTRCTVTVERVLVKQNPEWTAKFRAEFMPGGFCGHSPNQREQTHLFDRIDAADRITLRKNKRGDWVRGSMRFREGRAYHFYDYNF